MNIKIKSAGVACLIGDDYDRVYATLRKQLGEGDEQLFTERTPGHEYLQWELPGDGWVSLSDADPIMLQEVKSELLRRQQSVVSRFGANQEMAQRVLSVPDNSFIYYKADENGHLVIRLAAWGYRYPERIKTQDLGGDVKPKEEVEHTSISVVYDGRPVAGKTFRINGFNRVTGLDGRLDIGDLPIGYQFDIDIDGQHRHITVMPGQGSITIDTTVFTTVEVRATKDEQPYAGGVATLTYMGRQMSLTTDASGQATAKVPADPKKGLCTVTMENETQQMVLSDVVTTFTFAFTSPKVEEPPVKEEPPVEEPPVKEQQPDEEPPKEHVVPAEEPKKEEKAEEPKEEEQKPDMVIEKPEEPPVQEEPKQPAEKQPRSYAGLLLGLALVALVAATYAACAFLVFSV